MTGPATKKKTFLHHFHASENPSVGAVWETGYLGRGLQTLLWQNYSDTALWGSHHRLGWTGARTWLVWRREVGHTDMLDNVKYSEMRPGVGRSGLTGDCCSVCLVSKNEKETFLAGEDGDNHEISTAQCSVEISLVTKCKMYWNLQRVQYSKFSIVAMVVLIYVKSQDRGENTFSQQILRSLNWWKFVQINFSNNI